MLPCPHSEDSEVLEAVTAQLVTSLGSYDALLRHTALRALLSAPSLCLCRQELMVAVLVVGHDCEAENLTLAKRCGDYGQAGQLADCSSSCPLQSVAGGTIHPCAGDGTTPPTLACVSIHRLLHPPSCHGQCTEPVAS